MEHFCGQCFCKANYTALFHKCISIELRNSEHRCPRRLSNPQILTPFELTELGWSGGRRERAETHLVLFRHRYSVPALAVVCIELVRYCSRINNSWFTCCLSRQRQAACLYKTTALILLLRNCAVRKLEMEIPILYTVATRYRNEKIQKGRIFNCSLSAPFTLSIAIQNSYGSSKIVFSLNTPLNFCFWVYIWKSFRSWNGWSEQSAF